MWKPPTNPRRLMSVRPQSTGNPLKFTKACVQLTESRALAGGFNGFLRFWSVSVEFEKVCIDLLADQWEFLLNVPKSVKIRI